MEPALLVNFNMKHVLMIIFWNQRQILTTARPVYASVKVASSPLIATWLAVLVSCFFNYLPLSTTLFTLKNEMCNLCNSKKLMIQ